MNKNNAPDDVRPISFQWALALAFVAWFIEIVVSTVLRPMLIRHGIQPMAAASVIRVLCYGGVFSFMLHGSRMSYGQLLHPSQASLRATLGMLAPPILLMVPVILLVDVAMMWVLEQVLPMSDGEARWLSRGISGGIGSWVLVCAIAPMIEEMFFRGILLRGMLKRYATADAIVYSAFVFGFAHLNVYQFVVAFSMGLFAAVLYCRTRSLWPGIVLHAGLNTGVMVWSTASTSWVEPQTGFPPVWACVAAVASGVLGAWILRRVLWPARPQARLATDVDPTLPPPDTV